MKLPKDTYGILTKFMYQISASEVNLKGRCVCNNPFSQAPWSPALPIWGSRVKVVFIVCVLFVHNLFLPISKNLAQGRGYVSPAHARVGVENSVDRLCIVSARLCTLLSPLFLKNKFGWGWRQASFKRGLEG